MLPYYIKLFVVLQVFGVAIENQELTGKSVPLLVAKCVDYVETYGKFFFTQ